MNWYLTSKSDRFLMNAISTVTTTAIYGRRGGPRVPKIHASSSFARARNGVSCANRVSRGPCKEGRSGCDNQNYAKRFTEGFVEVGRKKKALSESGESL